MNHWQDSDPWKAYSVGSNAGAPNLMNAPGPRDVFQSSAKLVGGLEHFLFFHILEIIIPTDFHIFQKGLKPPTRKLWWLQEGCFICYGRNYWTKWLARFSKCVVTIWTFVTGRCWDIRQLRSSRIANSGNIYIPVWTKNIASHAKSILFTTAFLAVFLVFWHIFFWKCNLEPFAVIGTWCARTG